MNFRANFGWNMGKSGCHEMRKQGAGLKVFRGKVISARNFHELANTQEARSSTDVNLCSSTEISEKTRLWYCFDLP